MEALVCGKTGDPTVSITQENSPISLSTSYPIPLLNSPTAVRVAVRATSLNYANYLQVMGKYQEKPTFPFIPGSDYSGIVESVGSKVSKFKVGDPVCSFASLGSFAQFIVADETELYVPLVFYLFVMKSIYYKEQYYLLVSLSCVENLMKVYNTCWM